MISRNTKKMKQKGSVLVVGVVIVLVAISVSIGYAAAKSYVNRNKSQQQSVSSETDTNKPKIDTASKMTIGEMRQMVEMQMPRADVESKIGSPFYCTELKQAIDTDAKYEMQNCQYGDQNAPDSFNVTYMNGNVWGTSSVKN